MRREGFVQRHVNGVVWTVMDGAVSFSTELDWVICARMISVALVDVFSCQARPSRRLFRQRQQFSWEVSLLPGCFLRFSASSF